jgi:hypothetical protein
MLTDRGFVKNMFFRRHVYEHDGGVATQRYVEESGDDSIERGDLIREAAENAHRLIGCLNRMISNFESDFHEIFEPEAFCIEIENDRRKRMGKGNA